MQGAIRDINSLEKWFKAAGKPFFTLSYAGQVTQVIMRNTVNEDMDEAWAVLRDQVLAQTEYGRATLQVIVYDRDKSNNPAARTNIDMLPAQQATNGAYQAGIGSLPTNYASIGDIEKAIESAREKWLLEQRIKDLEAQIDNPEMDPVEKWVGVFERIASTPVGSVIISKITNSPHVPTPMPITGAPAPGPGAESDEDEEMIDPELDKLEAIAEKNGLTLKQLLAKTAALAAEQPGIVAMLASK